MMLVSKPWSRQRGERQCYFNKSMDALQVNWYPTNPYPIILEHPDGWTQQEMEDIRQKWPNLPLHFSKLGNAFHVHSSPPVGMQMEDQDKPLSPLGYKKMCAYKTFGFLQAPYIRTNELDYRLYIDDDACLTEPIQYDVFQTMKQHKVAYAYKQLFLDWDYVVKGLSEFVEEYVQKNRLQYANPSLRKWLLENTNNKNHWTFSTNLEWIDLQQLRQPNIRQFHQVIQDSGMIFHRRWGDAPLRFVLCYLFWDSSQVMKICSSYVHSMWQSSESTCDNENTKQLLLPVIQDAILNQLTECVPKNTCD